MRRLVAVLTVLFMPWSVSATSAQEKYPSKPIKLIVPLGPGTVNDVVARTVGEALSRDVKTEIAVEYRAGAGGVVGSDFVAKSSPDGYTLGVLNSSALTNSPAMMDKPPYDPLRDFTPLANVGANPALVAINAASPWKTLEEFVTHARKNPGKVSCGTSGVGTSGHFNLEVLKGAAGVQINHVPYKGGSPQNITALLGGHIDCASQIWPAVAGHVKGGKLRVLAVTSPVKEFPQLPTFAQSGFPQVTLEVSFGFYGPANLSKEVEAKLASALERAIKNPETSARLDKAGFPVAYEGPKVLSQRIARELALSREVARKAGIRAE